MVNINQKAVLEKWSPVLTKMGVNVLQERKIAKVSVNTNLFILYIQ